MQRKPLSITPFQGQGVSLFDFVVFESVFPFPNHLFSLYFKFSSFMDGPRLIINVFFLLTLCRGVPAPPICLPVSGPRGQRSGPSPLHILFLNHALLILEIISQYLCSCCPHNKSLCIVLLAHVVPHAEWLLFRSQRKVAMQIGLDAQAPKLEKERISRPEQNQKMDWWREE